MEMTIELMVFLGIGMVLLVMIVGFVYQWDFDKDIENLETLYQEEQISDDMKFNRVGFINAVSDFWEFCNHSYAPKDKIIYVYNLKDEPDGIMSKTDLFTYYKELSFCKSIQSRNLSCGSREDVNMTNITLPATVRLRCVNSTLHIK